MKKHTLLLSSVFLSSVLLLLGCSGTQNTNTAAAASEADTIQEGKPDTIPFNEASQEAPADYVPNELGKVMILEYHLIGEPEDRWRRSPANFKKDLQMLYDNGYYPVSVHELATGNLNVPAGKTPFAITFDDSSAGQFRYLEKNGQLIIDSQSAVGIMEEFKKQHADFPLTATFYVLPAIKPTLRLFAQPEYKKQKLEWLIRNGYEIGNHTWYHHRLDQLSDADAQKHLAMFVKEIREFIPDYEVKSLALPLGMHAKNRQLEESGESEGIKYKHESVLLVGSVTSVSPYSTKFNRLGIQRVQAGEHVENPETFMKSQIKHHTRFVSDGDPKTITAPEELKPELNPELQKKYTIRWIKAADNKSNL